MFHQACPLREVLLLVTIVSASLPSNASGTWHGTKSYSTSGALTITTKTDNIYLFGVKYEPSTTGSLERLW